MGLPFPFLPINHQRFIIQGMVTRGHLHGKIIPDTWIYVTLCCIHRFIADGYTAYIPEDEQQSADTQKTTESEFERMSRLYQGKDLFRLGVGSCNPYSTNGCQAQSRRRRLQHRTQHHRRQQRN